MTLDELEQRILIFSNTSISIGDIARVKLTLHKTTAADIVFSKGVCYLNLDKEDKPKNK